MNKTVSTLAAFVLAITATVSCARATPPPPAAAPAAATAAASSAPTATTAGGEQTAIFAGGCFWCVESDFEKLPGVTAAISGYIGGSVPDPGYERVSAGGTGHAEAVEVHFDASKVSYAQLVEYFWRHIDPTVKDQQFCDHGSQYRSAIFTQGAEQARIASQSKEQLLASKVLPGTVYTEIVAAGTFYAAEDYHQDYYKKNPVRYAYYRNGCGRDARVAAVWARAPASH